MQMQPSRGTGARVLGTLLAALAMCACVSVQPVEQVHSILSEQLVQVDDRLVYTEQAGKGIAVVLIHGFGASSYSWRDVIPELSDGHRIIAIDLFGFGWTERPENGRPFTRDGQVELVLGVMDSLGIDRAHIVGHSYGGAITMALAADHPGRVRSMVLVDSAAVDFPMLRRRWFARVGLFNWIYVRGLALRPDAVESAFHRAYYDESLITDELVQAYLDRLRVKGAARAYRGLTRPLPAELAPREIHYEDFKVPTLVLWGAQDEVVAPEVGSFHCGLVPGCRFVTIEGAGHSPMEEKPAEFLKEVTAFLDEIEGRPTSVTATASHGWM